MSAEQKADAKKAADAKAKKEEVKSSTPKKEQKASKPKVEKSKKKVYVFKYLDHLLLTEKSIDNINFNNTLVFVVRVDATKPQIKQEIEKAFDVKVARVNTLIDRKGRKKAYIKLKPEYSAVDVATELGMM